MDRDSVCSKKKKSDSLGPGTRASNIILGYKQDYMFSLQYSFQKLNVLYLPVP